MTGQHEQKPPKQERAISSLKMLIVHLAWLFFGPVALLIILSSVMNDETGWLTLADMVFFALVALTIFARWIEQSSGQGVTIEGKPSTWIDFRRYALKLPVFALAAWLVAKVPGRMFFSE
jgi:hypothetical protein